MRRSLQVSRWSIELLRDLVESEQSPLYLLSERISAANLFEGFPQKRGDICLSLFTGFASKKFEPIAPSLARIRAHHWSWIEEHAWSERPLFLIGSRVFFRHLYKHLRSVMRVRPPSGKVAYFRFCDAAMMLKFLRAADERTLRTFFSDKIAKIVIPDPSDGGSALCFELSPQ